tara:strand:- start:409 stop:942 length:534 start_codon:yes stop_codon:yes gene_type:complete
MLEDAIRGPFEVIIDNITRAIRNSRSSIATLSRTPINQPIGEIKWDNPTWLISEADTPIKYVPDTSQPTFPIFWLIIILIIPLILAMLYAHFLCKQGVNMIWLRYLMSQLPFIGSAFILLFLFFTWNPHLIQLVSILTVVILAIVLLLEEIVLLVYIIRQCCDTDCEESTTETPNHI